MRYFEKTAEILDVSDVENDIGIYLPDKEENLVRQMIRDQYQKRYPLRHPWVTGIPTLGIAPAISKDLALAEMRRPILRGNQRLLDRYVEERRHRDALRPRHDYNTTLNYNIN